ncbi:MmgE/PrpD family protein [Chloroflexota bacterium]
MENTRTRQLSEWVTSATYHDFPEETVSYAKGLLLKTVAGMLVGSRENIGKIMTTYLQGVGGAQEAGVVAGGFRTTVENAALANGTFAHASELEDDLLEDLMGDYWMFPAIFPLAEKLKSSGREVIEAAVVSWEVTSRLCRAAPGRLMVKNIGMCPATWFGIVGTAAAGAKLLKMNAEETENALCIAASHSCGLGEAGYDAHFIESGHSCRMGLLSAFLAKAGATGQPGILEEPRSFYAPVYSEGQVNLDIITDGLGKPPYSIHEASIKKYSACILTHSSIDALMALIKENDIKYQDVELVQTEVSKFARMAVNRPSPVSLVDARFSLQYLLGEVLLRGKVDIDTFVEEKLTDPEHNEAQSKVRVSVLPEVSREYPGAQVSVLFKNGNKLIKHLEALIGSPKYPLSIEQIGDVSRPYLDAMLDNAARERVEELVLNLEKQPDILELMDILTFSRVGQRI